MFPPNPTSTPAPRMGGEGRVERSVAADPAAQDVRQPTARRSWREKVRHAVDLTVAFVTLEDAPSGDHPSGGGIVDSGKDAGSATAARPRATDDAARTRNAPPARSVVDDRHPHRKPPRPMPRPRRPGAAAQRPQLCITPLHESSPAPKRRTRLA